MKKLIIANWKSNKSREEVVKWMDTFEERMKTMVVANMVNNDIVICPPMPSLMFVSNRLLNRQLFGQVQLGVQNVSPYPAGSYTGAVSVRNLEGFNVKYAIVGHSERRKYFNETNDDVAKKVEQCVEASITPIVCVDRNEVTAQAEAIDKDLHKKLVIAYEPIEFIGTGTAQPVEEVLEVMSEIKDVFPESRVIYGGSVNLDNIDEFKSHDQIAGFLVGSASLDADTFIDLI